MNTNWEVKKISEIGIVQTGTTPKTSNLNNYGNYIPFVKPADIDICGNGEVRYSDEGLSQEGLNSARKIDNGSILMVCIGASIGKVGFVDREVTCNQQINSLTVHSNYHPKFFYYALSTSLFYSQVLHDSAQATIPIINKSKWENLSVSFPQSLDEQQRIVAILDEAFAAIDRATAIAETNLNNARALFESYLQSVFANPGDDWEICKIEDYIKFIDYRGKTPEKTESGIRLITAKNVKLGYLQKTPEEFIDSNHYSSWMTRGIPKKGDVLFTTEAPLANVAQLDSDEKTAFAQRIIILQPKADKIYNTYLKYLMLSSPIRDKIIQQGTGATVQGIKASLLKKIEIYFPALSEQKAIVAKLDALSVETKKLEAIYQQKLVDLAELKKAILQKAFRGELIISNQ